MLLFVNMSFYIDLQNAAMRSCHPCKMHCFSGYFLPLLPCLEDLKLDTNCS
jgi:hypothetical protein